MELKLPGNVYLYKDGERQGQLDIGDVVSFPAENGEEVLITYNHKTALLIDAIISAEEECPSFRVQEKTGLFLAEALVTYVPDQEDITLQSVRFTGDIEPFVKKIMKKEAVAQK